MKKLLVILTAFALIVTVLFPISVPSANALVNSEPCQNGDHDFVVVSQEYYYAYGGRYYYTVNSCADVAYPHTHYYVTLGYIESTYMCQNCGYTKHVSAPICDLELGSICTLNDYGK